MNCHFLEPKEYPFFKPSYISPQRTLSEFLLSKECGIRWDFISVSSNPETTEVTTSKLKILESRMSNLRKSIMIYVTKMNASLHT